MSEARAAILKNIRQNLAASEPFDAVHQEHQAHHFAEGTDDAPLVTETALQDVSLIERFRENLISIGGNCDVVKDAQAAAEIIKKIAANINAKRIAVSDSALVESVHNILKIEAEFVKNAPAAVLFDCDLGITSAQWGIAETGTLVLESAREFNRLASLVPPVHICLLEIKNLRRTLGEILRNVSEGGQENMSRAITFITGPSRTSDIELTLAIGVHGPRELHVIIVAGENYE